MKVPAKFADKNKAQRDAAYFASPATFCAWLKFNHIEQSEFWVDSFRRESKKASITRPESVDEAL
jgi:hypothetical protein